MNWKDFYISELAQITSGININENKRILGTVPYISASAVNNGVTCFVDNFNKTFEAGCISINSNGSIGYSFYHPYEALYSGDCKKLRLNVKNKYVALFVARQITGQKDKYSYGYKLGTERLKRQKIKLPANSDGSPDYEFMENYIKSLEHESINKYLNYVLQKMPKKKEDLTCNLHLKQWRRFTIGEIFEINSGKRLTKDEMKPGMRPFIGASDSNNGITAFTSNKNISLDSNILGVNYNGSVVENFYHPYECIFSDDVKRFRLKNYVGNEYIYLFMKVLILPQKIKFGYGYKFNENRMKKQIIQLPINEAGEPDYKFMEEYIKNIEAELLTETISQLKIL